MAAPEIQEPETEYEIPAGIKAPLEGFPEVERIEPTTEPSSQPVKTDGNSELGQDRLFPVEEKAKPKTLKRRSGGSTPDPEGQATAERLPVDSITEDDKVFGRTQARVILENLENNSGQRGQTS